MSRYVKSIELYFENCDYLTIESKDIGTFHLSDINKIIRSLGCNNYITEESFVNEVYIEIFKSADKTHYPFNFKDENYKTTVFNRILTWNDITNITLTYNDDTEDYFTIDYDEEQPDVLGSPNRKQHAVVAPNGNLYVAISNKYKKIEDVFDWVDFGEKENNDDYVSEIKDIKLDNVGDTCYCWKCGKHKSPSEMDHSIVFASMPPKYQCLECAGKK